MSGKTAAIIGVTGLTGGYLYQQLKKEPGFDTIRLIVRRPMPKDDSRTEIKLVDFADAESLLLAIDGCDVVFCAVGTTNKKVKGDKEAYRKVDYDIPVKAARFCKMTGCGTFVLISAVGANKTSSNFYLRLKGETEDAIRNIVTNEPVGTGLHSVHFMRPSVLFGDRKESRPAEQIGKVLMQATSFLWPIRFKPVHAAEVAAAMIGAANTGDKGIFVHEYREIKRLAHRN